MRSFFVVALIALAITIGPASAAYPDRPIKVLMPFPPGGTVDVVARLTAARLSENLGQQFIVDNRPGANGTIGSAAVAKSPPDGYTLLVQASTYVATALLMDRLPYDISKDFTPITNLGAVPLVVTCFPGIPVKDLSEFVSAIRAQPNKYVFGTSAVGSASHLAQAAIRFQAKLDFTIIPYKGTAPALADVMGGHISAMVDALPSTMPHVKSGKLRPLAVTSARRVPSLPNVPTVAESGLEGFEMVSWYGLWGPAKLPRELAAKVQQEVARALKSQQVSEILGEHGFVVSGSTPADFGEYIRQELNTYARLIKAAGIKLD